MSRPTQGERYTTKQGDTFESISAQAYGDPTLALNIANVNPMQEIVELDDALPTGLSLIIPVDQEFETLRQEQLANGLRGIK